MSDTPADAQGRSHPDHRDEGDEPSLEIRRDVLMPDLRKTAEDQGRDPEEVDPILDDEEHGRLDSLGGTTGLG